MVCNGKTIRPSEKGLLHNTLHCVAWRNLRRNDPLLCTHFSFVPLHWLYSRSRKSDFDAVYSRCQSFPVRLHHRVFERNGSFVEQVPRASCSCAKRGDILRIRSTVPSPECTDERVFHWQVQVRLLRAGFPVQSVHVPRAGSEC